MEMLGILLKDMCPLGSFLLSVANQAQSLEQNRPRHQMETFQLFMTCVILEKIVRQTKLFAALKKINLQFCVEEFISFFRNQCSDGTFEATNVA